MLWKWSVPCFSNLTPQPTQENPFPLYCLWILFSNHTSSPRRAITGALCFSNSWCTHNLNFFKRKGCWRVGPKAAHERKEYDMKKNKTQVHRCTPSNNSYSNTTVNTCLSAWKNQALCRCLYLQDTSHSLQSFLRDLALMYLELDWNINYHPQQWKSH